MENMVLHLGGVVRSTQAQRRRTAEREKRATRQAAATALEWARLPRKRRGVFQMACYPCIHCNKCGMFSVKAVTVCSECGREIPPGTVTCPDCGSKKFTAKVVES